LRQNLQKTPKRKQKNEQLLLHAIPQKPNIVEMQKLAQTAHGVRMIGVELSKEIQKTINAGQAPDEWACSPITAEAMLPLRLYLVTLRHALPSTGKLPST